MLSTAAVQDSVLQNTHDLSPKLSPSSLKIHTNCNGNVTGYYIMARASLLIAGLTVIRTVRTELRLDLKRRRLHLSGGIGNILSLLVTLLPKPKSFSSTHIPTSLFITNIHASTTPRYTNLIPFFLSPS
jgi:hypothetical protein